MRRLDAARAPSGAVEQLLAPDGAPRARSWGLVGSMKHHALRIVRIVAGALLIAVGIVGLFLPLL